MPRRTLHDIVSFRIPGLKDELGVVCSKGTDYKQPQKFEAYVQAAEAIQEEGNLCSPRLLAEKLGWRVKRVQRYLREHPELSVRLSLYTDDQSHLWSAARTIVQRGEQVTRLTLAVEMGCAYITVCRILGNSPTDFMEEAGVCRARRGSGVYEQLHSKVAMQ